MGGEVHAKLLEVVPSCLGLLPGFGLAHQDADRHVDCKLCPRRSVLRRWCLLKVHSLGVL